MRSVTGDHHRGSFRLSVEELATRIRLVCSQLTALLFLCAQGPLSDLIYKLVTESRCTSEIPRYHSEAWYCMEAGHVRCGLKGSWTICHQQKSLTRSQSI